LASVRLRNEFTTLLTYITETGATYHDYANPAGEVNGPERISFLDASPQRETATTKTRGTLT